MPGKYLHLVVNSMHIAFRAFYFFVAVAIKDKHPDKDSAIIGDNF
jgi:hypothetical protein